MINVRTSSRSSLVVIGDRTLSLLMSPRCVVGVRTSSLLILGDRTLCYYYRLGVWSCWHVIAVIICCPRGLTLPRAMCSQCSHVISVIAGGYRVSNPFATNITAMCGQRSHIIVVIACVRRGSNPSATAIVSPPCVVSVRTSSLLILGDPFCYYHRRDV